MNLNKPSKRRAVIYARVSTAHEAQLYALENQIDWYRNILEMNPDLEQEGGQYEKTASSCCRNSVSAQKEEVHLQLRNIRSKIAKQSSMRVSGGVYKCIIYQKRT